MTLMSEYRAATLIEFILFITIFYFRIQDHYENHMKLSKSLGYSGSSRKRTNEGGEG